MITSQTIGARLGLAMLGAGLLLGATPALAQAGAPVAGSPAEALSRNLRSLAENPKSLHALMGAGKAALELGDPQAAITFFGRAEEQAPRDGRIKMWLGSALVHLQQAQGALKFFAEASSLGVPEAEVAAQRGLAYDLLGDPRRAQRDYRLALQSQPSAEVSRRLALSLAISGEREAALQALEGQLLIRDRAAERTKVFVLALTGDVAGASRAIQASMPGKGAAMTPFLERLPALSPSERALAVHLGHFPSHARNLPVPPPNTYAAFTPSVTRAGTPDPRQTALGTRTAAPAKAQPAQRQPAAGQAQRVASAGTQQPARVQTPAATPQRSASAAPSESKAEPRRSTSAGTNGSVNPLWALSRGASPVRRSEPAEVKQAAPAAAQQVAATQPAAVAPPQAAPVQQQASAALPPPFVPQPSAAPVQQQLLAAASVPPPQPQATATAPVTPAPQQGAPSVAIAEAQLPPSAAAAPASTPAAQNPVQLALAAPAPGAAAPGFSISAAEPAAPPAQGPLSELASVEAPPPASGVGEQSGASRLAGIASLIASLPETAPADETREAPARPAAKPTAKPAAPAKAAAAASTAGKKEAPAKVAAKKEAPAPARKPAVPAEPSRIWVQVAGGADKAALPREFTRLKGKAPKLLAARTAWTTPLKATNRLLVGPFKTDKEAQEFVNELRKADLSGFAWTSDAGQKIEKLSAK